MGLVFERWYGDIFLLIAAALFAAYVYFKRSFTYWEKIGVPLPWEPGVPFGHFKGISTKKSMGMIAADMYHAAKGQRFTGAYFFNSPALLIRDMDLVKDILVKEFTTFHDRGFELDVSKEPLVGHLFLMNGQEWRNLRIKLTPTFTSGKMKMMFNTLVEVGNQFEHVLDASCDSNEVDLKDILARYSTDVIASCAFGIEANSLKNPDEEFRAMGRELGKPSWKQIIMGIIMFMFPKLGRLLPFKFVPPHITEFFVGVVRDTMKYREENNVQRNDFMQLMLQLKTLGYVKDADSPVPDSDRNTKFTVEQAAAQAFLFFFAGFETASSTMLFALYELALNPDLQMKAQAELDELMSEKNNERLTYEGVLGLPLLDRIVSETLRKYAPVGTLIRECNKDYKIPDTNTVIPAKTKIWFPVYGYHHDEKYYPNPEKFDPDRFLPEVKDARNHYAYMPFGEGPRNCIGNRFGLMQIKVALAITLSRFNVAPSEKTPIPMVFDPRMDLLTPKGKMHLKISKRTN